MADLELLDKSIRRVPDFPKPGILFYDITSVFVNPEAFKYCIDKMVEIYKDSEIEAIAGVDSRGFLFAAPLAEKLGIPMVLNPILGIPFVITANITILVAYVLTVIGFCPIVCISVPWTTPPILFGFLATGANIMGAVTQAILIVVSTVIYTPFLLAGISFKV